MAEEGQANGWQFWDKVYTNKDLRKTNNEQAQINEVSMSELLRSTHLARAEITVQNVPRLSPTHIHVVQNLIKKDLKLDVLILSVEVTTKRWTFRFYRREDASLVLRTMTGHVFKGMALHLTLQEEVDVTQMATEKEPEMNVLQEVNPNWACVEWTQLKSFKNDLVGLLEQHVDGMSIEEVLADTGLSRRRGLLRISVEENPASTTRCTSRRMFVTGGCFSTTCCHLLHQPFLLPIAEAPVEIRRTNVEVIGFFLILKTFFKQ